jgi:hypothetical protein
MRREEAEMDEGRGRERGRVWGYLIMTGPEAANVGTY